MTNRSFIVDFGCCLPFGHNIESVRLHHDYQERKGRATTSLVCRGTRSYLNQEEEKKIHCVLPPLYRELLVDAEANIARRFLLRLMNFIVHFPFGKFRIPDLRAFLSVRKIFKKYRFSAGDYILFPSADYHGVRAFIKRLGKLPEHQRPDVHFRFIAVLEHARHTPRNGLSHLVRLINRYHTTITVGAEVPAYARYLNTVMPNISVGAEPYPVKAEGFRTRQRRPDSAPFTIVVPGTNRADKGYYDLLRISREIFFQFPHIKLIIQDMKKWDPRFDKKYQAKLSRMSNVQLVDAIIPRSQLDEIYEQADLIFLPYDPRAYYFRGSAVHYEAIARGIPVLVPKGVGFMEEVESWSSGWAYETRQELFKHLTMLMELDNKTLTARMRSAQLKFRESI